MRQALGQQGKRTRAGLESLAAAFDFKVAFEDVEGLVFEMVDVERSAMVRRDGAFGDRVLTFSVFTAGFVGEENALHVEL